MVIALHYLCGMKILMVCLGNICRSPLAEGILKNKAEAIGLDWTIESAGTNGLNVGEAPHHLSQKVAKSNGIDISCQISRQFEPGDFEKYDRIFAMANDVMDEMREIAGERFEDSKADLLLNILHPGKDHDVPDPWYGGESGYIDVYNMLNDACEAVIKKYSSEKKDN
jgi:protein-tyrosine phosphatase